MNVAGNEIGYSETNAIEGFVIEAYADIIEVPFAECGAVPNTKSWKAERDDAFCRFCRNCLTESSKPILSCEQYNRVFHLTCVRPRLLKPRKDK